MMDLDFEKIYQFIARAILLLFRTTLSSPSVSSSAEKKEGIPKNPKTSSHDEVLSTILRIMLLAEGASAAEADLASLERPTKPRRRRHVA